MCLVDDDFLFTHSYSDGLECKLQIGRFETIQKLAKGATLTGVYDEKEVERRRKCHRYNRVPKSKGKMALQVYAPRAICGGDECISFYKVLTKLMVEFGSWRF